MRVRRWRNHVTGVKFTPKTIQAYVDGTPVYDRLKIEKPVPEIGHYSKHKPVVRVDSRIKGKERKAIAVHEVVERFMRFDKRGPHYGPVKAHKIASQYENEYNRVHKINIAHEEKDVNRLWGKIKRNYPHRRHK